MSRKVIPIQVDPSTTGNEQPMTGKPSWLKVKAPTSPEYRELVKLMRDKKLNTVCEEASCPNIGECWKHGSATFMILGRVCTRTCAFCDVETGRPDPVDAEEPDNTADAVESIQVIDTPSQSKGKRKGRAKTRPKATSKRPARPDGPTTLDADQERLFERLREWRLTEARKRGVPAFRILSDRVLAAICRARPADEEELLDISGIGPHTTRKFGRGILGVVNPA